MKALISLVGVVIFFGVLAAAWAANCSGPRPQVEEVTLEAPEPADHAYRVSAVIRNKGRNGGEVTVRFELVNRADGGVIHARENVDLDPRKTQIVSVEISAPPGDYEARASVDYPPP